MLVPVHPEIAVCTLFPLCSCSASPGRCHFRSANCCATTLPRAPAAPRQFSQWRRTSTEETAQLAAVKPTEALLTRPGNKPLQKFGKDSLRGGCAPAKPAAPEKMLPSSTASCLPCTEQENSK